MLMNISFAKGGDYSVGVISGFAHGYIEHGLYKEYIEKDEKENNK